MSLFSFFGSKNPEEVYTSIAQSFVVCALSYRKELNEEDNKKSADAAAEIIYLLMHVLDRVAFSALGSEKRNSVFDSVSEIALDDYTKATISGAPIELQLAIKTKMFEDLEARQTIYGKCDSLAGEFPAKGTMIFALSYYINKALELTHIEDVEDVLTGIGDVTDENSDAFPDISKLLENAIWIANIVTELKLEKKIKQLK